MADQKQVAILHAIPVYYPSSIAWFFGMFYQHFQEHSFRNQV